MLVSAMSSAQHVLLIGSGFLGFALGRRFRVAAVAGTSLLVVLVGLVLRAGILPVILAVVLLQFGYLLGVFVTHRRR